MISIIICSRSSSLLTDVSKNVSETIGVPFEIISIDNSRGQYSIFEAYNIGIYKSSFPVLCFMHEDISFETPNWGRIVVRTFEENRNLGLLGVAGSSYKSLVPSGWTFETAYVPTIYANVIQHYKSGVAKKQFSMSPRGEKVSKVATVDGLWFCTPKAVAEQIGFDAATFNNFHCYDIDYSLAVLQKYDVAVTFEVLINHYSEGSLDKNWLTETFKLHKKWEHVLPVNIDKISSYNKRKQEFNAFHSFLLKVIGNKENCLRLGRALLNVKLLKLLGVKKISRMYLVVIKKAFL